jgi:hypothetical protein
MASQLDFFDLTGSLRVKVSTAARSRASMTKIEPTGVSPSSATSVPAVTRPSRTFEPHPYPEGRLGRNPAGRPKVSRHKIGEAFLAALHADFVQYGSCDIERVREERPADCLKVVASILAKEL